MLLPLATKSAKERIKGGNDIDHKTEGRGTLLGSSTLGDSIPTQFACRAKSLQDLERMRKASSRGKNADKSGQSKDVHVWGKEIKCPARLRRDFKGESRLTLKTKTKEISADTIQWIVCTPATLIHVLRRASKRGAAESKILIQNVALLVYKADAQEIKHEREGKK